jgi:hypothetical protein
VRSESHGFTQPRPRLRGQSRSLVLPPRQKEPIQYKEGEGMYFYKNFLGFKCKDVGFLLTLNNPQTHGYNDEIIKKKLEELPTIMYFCFCHEIAPSGTPHMHIYLLCKEGTTFNMIKDIMPQANIQPANGTSVQNRLYILKQGDWKDTDKALTSVEGSFYEFGNINVTNLTRYFSVSEVTKRIREGWTDEELFRKREYLALLEEIYYIRRQIGIPDVER